MPFQKMFDCSTGHLSPATRDFLDGLAVDLPMIRSNEHGYFIPVTLLAFGDQQSIPDDLKAVLTHVAQRDGRYVLFDQDAPAVQDLPWYGDSDLARRVSEDEGVEIVPGGNMVLPDGDYIIDGAAWFTLGPASIRMRDVDGFVEVEVYPLGREMDDPIHSLYIEDSELDADTSAGVEP